MYRLDALYVKFAQHAVEREAPEAAGWLARHPSVGADRHSWVFEPICYQIWVSKPIGFEMSFPRQYAMKYEYPSRYGMKCKIRADMLSNIGIQAV